MERIWHYLCCGKMVPHEEKDHKCGELKNRMKDAEELLAGQGERESRKEAAGVGNSD